MSDQTVFPALLSWLPSACAVQTTTGGDLLREMLQPKHGENVRVVSVWLPCSIYSGSTVWNGIDVSRDENGRAIATATMLFLFASLALRRSLRGPIPIVFQCSDVARKSVVVASEVVYNEAGTDILGRRLFAFVQNPQMRINDYVCDIMVCSQKAQAGRKRAAHSTRAAAELPPLDSLHTINSAHAFLTTAATYLDLHISDEDMSRYASMPMLRDKYVPVEKDDNDEEDGKKARGKQTSEFGLPLVAEPPVTQQARRQFLPEYLMSPTAQRRVMTAAGADPQQVEFDQYWDTHGLFSPPYPDRFHVLLDEGIDPMGFLSSVCPDVVHAYEKLYTAFEGDMPAADQVREAEDLLQQYEQKLAEQCLEVVEHVSFSTVMRFFPGLTSETTRSLQLSWDALEGGAGGQTAVEPDQIAQARRVLSRARPAHNTMSSIVSMPGVLNSYVSASAMEARDRINDERTAEFRMQHVPFPFNLTHLRVCNAKMFKRVMATMYRHDMPMDVAVRRAREQYKRALDVALYSWRCVWHPFLSDCSVYTCILQGIQRLGRERRRFGDYLPIDPVHADMSLTADAYCYDMWTYENKLAVVFAHRALAFAHACALVATQRTRDIHMCLLNVGPMEGSKSFVLSLVAMLLLPYTAKSVHHSTSKAVTVMEGANMKVLLFDEMAWSMLATINASAQPDGGASGQIMKAVITSGIMITQEPVRDEQTGQRKMAETSFELIMSFIGNLNQDLHLIAPPMQSRLAKWYFAPQNKRDDRPDTTQAVITDPTSYRSYNPTVLWYQAQHALIAEAFARQYAKVMSEVSLLCAFVIVPRFLQNLRLTGLFRPTTRTMLRILKIARKITMDRAARNTWMYPWAPFNIHNPQLAGRDPYGPEAWRYFELRCWASEEDVALAISMCADEYAPSPVDSLFAMLGKLQARSAVQDGYFSFPALRDGEPVRSMVDRMATLAAMGPDVDKDAIAALLMGMTMSTVMSGSTGRKQASVFVTTKGIQVHADLLEYGKKGIRVYDRAMEALKKAMETPYTRRRKIVLSTSHLRNVSCGHDVYMRWARDATPDPQTFRSDMFDAAFKAKARKGEFALPQVPYTMVLEPTNGEAHKIPENTIYDQVLSTALSRLDGHVEGPSETPLHEQFLTIHSKTVEVDRDLDRVACFSHQAAVYADTEDMSHTLEEVLLTAGELWAKRMPGRPFPGEAKFPDKLVPSHEVRVALVKRMLNIRSEADANRRQSQPPPPIITEAGEQVNCRALANSLQQRHHTGFRQEGDRCTVSALMGRTDANGRPLFVS